MLNGILQEFLKVFNRRMTCENHKVLLFMDNAPIHIIPHNITNARFHNRGKAFCLPWGKMPPTQLTSFVTYAMHQSLAYMINRNSQMLIAKNVKEDVLPTATLKTLSISYNFFSSISCNYGSRQF